MAENYYVRIRGKVKGPYTADKIIQQVRRKRVGRHHEISEDGVTWQKAGDFSEFFEAEVAAFEVNSLDNINDDVFEEDVAELASPSTPVIPVGTSAVNSGVPRNKPDNYLVPSIFSMLCCCVPLGIVALVYANQVDSKYNSGDYEGAEQSAASAKMWVWIAFGLGLVSWFCGLIFWFFFMGVALTV